MPCEGVEIALMLQTCQQVFKIEVEHALYMSSISWQHWKRVL